MKKILTFIAIVLLFRSEIIAQNNIGIGTTTPHSSSALDISSTTRGMLVPRMTTLQRTAIASPATGLLVYDTDINSFWFYNGASWSNLSAGGSGFFSLPFDTTLNLPGVAFRIANNGTSIEASSISSSGVNTYSTNGAGINTLSSNGFGMVATSVNSTAVYAFSNNAFPTINASNSYSGGIAIKGNSSLSHGILGISGGISKSGIRGEATGAAGNGVYGIATASDGYGLYGYNLVGTGVYGFSNSGTGIKAISNSGLALDVTGKLRIAGGNTTPSNGAVLTSDANGNATWKNNNIAFRVKGVNSGQTGISYITSRKVEFEMEDYDLGNNYALLVGTVWPSSSTFTVPKSGIYHFDISIGLGYLPSGTYDYGNIVLVRKRNGITSSVAHKEFQFYNLDFTNLCLSSDVQLQVNDQIWVTVSQTNTAGDPSQLSVGTDTYFSGHLVIAE